MDDTIVMAAKLRQAWRELGDDVRKNKKLKFDMFESTFSQTYSLLYKHINEKSLDKDYIELVAEAFLFANITDDSLDNSCLAAFVLTERMLTYCAFGNSPASVDASSIYIVEARRDVVLDFNDPGESVSKLTKIFEDMYWKKV